MRSPFTPPFERLPGTIPIFPLPNAVVMPGAQLPLNIFEPRYLNMIFDSLGESRLIGMVQPRPDDDSAAEPDVYQTGTAGLITSYSETTDGRLLIVLTGVCRFDIEGEMPTTRGYRRVVADWSRFELDYDAAPETGGDRQRFMSLLKAYFNREQLEVDWSVLEGLAPHVLHNLLIGQLPFGVAERQTLIDTVAADDRARLLAGLIDQAISGGLGQTAKPH
jgi:hypothetical protein